MRYEFRETNAERHARLEAWHPWFAWRPVFIKTRNGRDAIVWLGWIERKLTWSDGWDGEYRELES